MPELRLPASTPLDLALDLRRFAATCLQRKGDLNPQGLAVVDGAGTLFHIPWLKYYVIRLDVSATLTATAFFPAGSIIFGVFARNQTAITGSLASYRVGDGTFDRWHLAHPLGIQAVEKSPTWQDTAQFTGTWPVGPLTADGDVVLAPNGGTFSTGTVEIHGYALDFKIF